MLSEDLGKGNVAARQSRIKLQEVIQNPPLLHLLPTGANSCLAWPVCFSANCDRQEGH